MAVDPAAFQHRTKAFALVVIRFSGSLPPGEPSRVISRQLLRSATSSAANYRSACRARSRQDMLHKLGIVEEELDETLFWLELVHESGLTEKVQVDEMVREANEILAMVVASRKTLRARLAAIDNRQSTIGNRHAAS